jgi:hypothetical protein
MGGDRGSQATQIREGGGFVVDLLFEEEEVIEVVVFFGLPHWAEDVSDRCGYIRKAQEVLTIRTMKRPLGDHLVCWPASSVFASSPPLPVGQAD